MPRVSSMLIFCLLAFSGIQVEAQLVAHLLAPLTSYFKQLPPIEFPTPTTAGSDVPTTTAATVRNFQGNGIDDNSQATTMPPFVIEDQPAVEQNQFRNNLEKLLNFGPSSTSSKATESSSSTDPDSTAFTSTTEPMYKFLSTATMAAHAQLTVKDPQPNWTRNPQFPVNNGPARQYPTVGQGNPPFVIQPGMQHPGLQHPGLQPQQFQPPPQRQWIPQQQQQPPRFFQGSQQQQPGQPPVMQHPQAAFPRAPQKGQQNIQQPSSFQDPRIAASENRDPAIAPRPSPSQNIPPPAQPLAPSPSQAVSPPAGAPVATPSLGFPAQGAPQTALQATNPQVPSQQQSPSQAVPARQMSPPQAAPSQAVPPRQMPPPQAATSQVVPQRLVPPPASPSQVNSMHHAQASNAKDRQEQDNTGPTNADSDSNSSGAVSVPKPVRKHPTMVDSGAMAPANQSDASTSAEGYSTPSAPVPSGNWSTAPMSNHAPGPSGKIAPAGRDFLKTARRVQFADQSRLQAPVPQANQQLLNPNVGQLLNQPNQQQMQVQRQQDDNGSIQK